VYTAELSDPADSEATKEAPPWKMCTTSGWLFTRKRSVTACRMPVAAFPQKVPLLPRDSVWTGWMKTLPQPGTVAMEATMFTGWIYDHLLPHAAGVKVAHPLTLRAIVAAKNKNDRIDAKKISDGLRCDFLPECYMASTGIRERRRTLRYRNLLVHQAVQLNIHEGLRALLGLCRETLVRLQKTESALVRSLQRDSLLAEPVERLRTIPAVGPIPALPCAARSW
jgi:transposase